MTTAVGTLPPALRERSVRLSSDTIEVIVLPDKGADVHAFVDRATGIDVFFKPPWEPRDPGPAVGALDEAGWLDRYHGGWQLLLPNAGPPREVGGAVRGYHGEASVSAWQVDACTSSRLAVSVRLAGPPLALTRVFEVQGSTLAVSTEVTNLGDAAVPVSWVEHPAFGDSFVDARTLLDSGARSVVADADDPGTVLAPDVLSPVSRAVTREGGWVDLRHLPHGPRKVFAALTDFDDGTYTVTSPTAGFGVRVEWDTAVFPHAWFWQDLHATSGFPWYGRAYAVAIEPSNVLPGAADSTDPARMAAPLLAAGASWATTVRMSRVA